MFTMNVYNEYLGVLELSEATLHVYFLCSSGGKTKGTIGHWGDEGYCTVKTLKSRSLCFIKETDQYT